MHPLLLATSFIHHCAVCGLTLSLAMAFILSSANLWQTKSPSTWSNTKFGFVITISSTGRSVFTPKRPRGQVTCHLLQPPSQRPQSPLEKWGIFHAQLGFHVRVCHPDCKSMALSAKQKLSGRHFACCYSRFTPKGTFLTLVPTTEVFLIQTQWGLR